jgi:hypothetical protein
VRRMHNAQIWLLLLLLLGLLDVLVAMGVQF